MQGVWHSPDIIKIISRQLTCGIGESRDSAFLLLSHNLCRRNLGFDDTFLGWLVRLTLHVNEFLSHGDAS